VAGLEYRGRTPSSDSHLVAKGFSDTTYAAKKVDAAYVDAALAAAKSSANLANEDYVDAGDAMRAQKTDVDAADTAYIPASQLGAVNGVASLDADGSLIAAQVPAGILTERLATSYTAAEHGTVNLTAGLVQEVSTTNIREVKLAGIPVPDPGYPWYPLPLAWVGGLSGGVDPGNRRLGTNDFGRLLVLPPAGVSDVIYGATVCTGVPYLDYYPVLPHATTGGTPMTHPPIHGALQLNLYASLWSGTSYVFHGTGLTFMVFQVPAMG